MSTTERAGDPADLIEQAEEVLSWAGLAAVATIRIVELVAVAVAVLLVVPPLAILVVVVVVPLIALTALVAVVTLPVIAIRHAHRHRAAHAHHLVRRIANAGRSEQAAMTSRVRRVVARAQRKLYAKPSP
jgi:hypothetical protein